MKSRFLLCFGVSLILLLFDLFGKDIFGLEHPEAIICVILLLVNYIFFNFLDFNRFNGFISFLSINLLLLVTTSILSAHLREEYVVVVAFQLGLYLLNKVSLVAFKRDILAINAGAHDVKKTFFDWLVLVIYFSCFFKVSFFLHEVIF